MKANNFGINSFTDKLAENHLSKFSKTEFLSKSNKFSDALKKSDENKEEKSKYEKKDFHISKLEEKIKSQLSGQENLGIESLNSLDGEFDIEGALNGYGNNNKSIDALKLENKVAQLKASSTEVLSGDGDSIVSDKKIKSEPINELNKSKFKLDDSFKLTEKNQQININELGQLNTSKQAEKALKLGLSNIDLKSKNDLLIKNTLRNKNIDTKSKFGKINAAKLYEKQQPVENSKSVQKANIVDGVVSNVVSKKIKGLKPISVSNLNSETLKNDLASNMSEVDQELDSKEVIGKEFSKIMDLKSQFKSEGIDEVIKQAQFLANKGGGEMKLLLNPKGLGAVRLKVLLEENQLKVEMSTETKEAQEVIEATLGDLKKALANGQLDVDSITIDNFEQLAEFSAEQDAEKQNQFAKDFLSEFRHGNDKFRSGLIDFPSVKQRKSQVIEGPSVSSLTPLNSERKLDLVA